MHFLKFQFIPMTSTKQLLQPFGAFQYHYMPFGLSGASQSFQRFNDTALHNITVTYPKGITKEITVFAYVDDILLASDNEESQLVELKALFPWLTDYGLRISPLKCEFGKQSLEFLGHQINIDGTEPLPEKVAAMRNYEKPNNANRLRRYLGMINFYRWFVQNSANTLMPLNNLLAEQISS